MAGPIKIDLEAAEARARRIEATPPPPENETAEERALRIEAEPESETEESVTETPATDTDSHSSSEGEGLSGLKVRASFANLLAGTSFDIDGTTMDTPQPSDLGESTANLSTSGEATPQLAGPVTMLHASYFPGKQPLSPRIGGFVSWRRYEAIREDNGFHQETSVDLIGAGLTATYGPLIDQTLKGFWRSALSWNDGTINIGFVGAQASLGVAVAHVDVDVARPNELDAHERGGEWAFATTLPVPLYAEIEVTILYVTLGDEKKPWGQITAGFDNYFFWKATDRPTGGIEDFFLGDRTADGDFRVRGYLHPTVGFQLFWE